MPSTVRIFFALAAGAGAGLSSSTGALGERAGTGAGLVGCGWPPPHAATTARITKGRVMRPGVPRKLELEVDAREPGRVTDGQLGVAAKAIDLGERQLAVEAGVLDSS